MPGIAGRLLTLLAVCLAACGAPVSDSEASADTLEYVVTYRAIPRPADHSVEVELEIAQSRNLLREMRFDVDGLSDIKGDGGISIENGRLRWQPPERGGTLSWRTIVANKRNGDGYDAWLNADWGLFRAEDIIPRAATRTLKGATSKTVLTFDLPRGWSAVSEYELSGASFQVTKADRRFAQPSGWVVIGNLGVRRDRIAGIRVAVAGPANMQIRRLDMLAMLNWTLPELARIVDKLPRRLTIVAADDPMWRGALSAPQSIYMHSDRPLISENGTSTLLHELMHVALDVGAAEGYDWIAEGLAEYYSIELLGRSGTLTPARYDAAFERQKSWSESARKLCGASSSGASTALAVVRLRALDKEIREWSAGEASLDDVIRILLESREQLSVTSLQAASESITGEKPDALHIDKLPGCRKLAAAD